METTTSIEKLPYEELDDAVAEVKKYARRSASSMYKLGQALRRIRENELWKLRLNHQTGEQVYISFSDFCASEIPISDSYIRRLMSLTEEFTLRDVKKHGVARLAMSMRVPKETRKKFLRKTKSVPSCSREFTQIAREFRNNPTQEKSYAEPTNAIPVDLPLGLQVMPMWKKTRGAVERPSESATSLLDDPWTKLALPGDVMLHVRLSRNPTGELMALIEFRHGKETPQTRTDY